MLFIIKLLSMVLGFALYIFSCLFYIKQTDSNKADIISKLGIISFVIFYGLIPIGIRLQTIPNVINLSTTEIIQIIILTVMSICFYISFTIYKRKMKKEFSYIENYDDRYLRYVYYIVGFLYLHLLSAIILDEIDILIEFLIYILLFFVFIFSFYVRLKYNEKK